MSLLLLCVWAQQGRLGDADACADVGIAQPPSAPIYTAVFGSVDGLDRQFSGMKRVVFRGTRTDDAGGVIGGYIDSVKYTTRECVMGLSAD